MKLDVSDINTTDYYIKLLSHNEVSQIGSKQIIAKEAIMFRVDNVWVTWCFKYMAS